MPDDSSFVITHLLDGLAQAIPDAERARLAAYRTRAQQAGSDRSAEWHRAFRVARWATDMAAVPARSAVGRFLRQAAEVVKQVEELIGSEVTNAVDLALLGPSVPVAVEAEIAWVHEAVELARAVAEKEGWDAVSWAGLVEELLAMGE